MKRLIKNILGILLILASVTSHAQSDVQMADGMRAEGKIYVVVAIILIVLAGLIFYLVMLDRKVKKLEKLLSARNPSTK
ncbi:MAG: CcmD family protein [Marivirga sp.]|nr:CcmD family protein [Marivirga sp.]